VVVKVRTSLLVVTPYHLGDSLQRDTAPDPRKKQATVSSSDVVRSRREHSKHE